MACTTLTWVLTACVGRAQSPAEKRVDELCRKAYEWRYKNLDSTRHFVQEAWQLSEKYDKGRACALNELAFVAFMQMDYAESKRLHQEALSTTNDALEALVAEVGLMKVCQRTAMNKEFFDHRTQALKQMKRLHVREVHQSPLRQKRLTYVHAEYHIVTAIYHYYLQQRERAEEMLQVLEGDIELRKDTNQLLYYHYIKGATALCGGDTQEERKLTEFDQLYYVWMLASRKGYTYFDGNALQGLSNLMISPADFDFYNTERPYAMQLIHQPIDSLMPYHLARRALNDFKAYGDPYQVAGAYVSMGRFFNNRGHYEEALDTLQQALHCLQQEAPECASRIREQLSVTYAGLGNKEASDYNRNIYLDILDATRQDKEMESRLQQLETESQQLNWLLWMLAIAFVLVVIFFLLFNRWSQARNKQHLLRLRKLIEIGQQTMTSIPADATSNEEVQEAVESYLLPELNKLFDKHDFCIEQGKLVSHSHLKKEEKALLQLIEPYAQWVIDNGQASVSLGDEQQRMEKERYVYEQHLADRKRQNLVKKACVSIVTGIHPYLDRLAHQVQKLLTKEGDISAEMQAERYQYMSELLEVINEHNEILARWIKLKQGTLNLHIETFALDELFELMKKGSRTFQLKQQQLEVIPTRAVVKADKALTLFMLSTLTENARKYTDAGGHIRIHAQSCDNYVEISVEDNGRGLSEQDVALILGEKVYDSNRIGMQGDAATRHQLKQRKGHGFGLMNCKGIIEKYRKTNPLFQVCMFSVESTLGRGSRFFFRLPVAVGKALGISLLFLASLFTSCTTTTTHDAATLPLTLIDESEAPDEALLDSASIYADEAYFSNVDGNYEQTLCYIDSAIMCLNAHYRQHVDAPGREMLLVGKGQPAELGWWRSTYNTDFHVILDIRNEAAVAFLALKQIDEYHYNNTIYTTLYKLLGEDHSLQDYCIQLERSASYKLAHILLGILLLLSLPAGYYLLYYRKRLTERRRLKEVLGIGRSFSRAAHSEGTGESHEADGETLQQIPQRMVNVAHADVCRLLQAHQLCLAVYDESAHKLQYAAAPHAPLEAQTHLMQQCFEAKTPLWSGDAEAFPLLIEVGEESRCIGVILFARGMHKWREADQLAMQLITRHAALLLFNAVVKLATRYRDIEEVQDEVRRVSWEESQLHVQNQVLDNCLSSIKHETLYYPNRIRQLVDKLQSEALPPAEVAENLQSIHELTAYYQGIFGLLSQCALRQLDDVSFRRSTLRADDVLQAAQKYFVKCRKRAPEGLALQINSSPATLYGDRHLLAYLLEILIEEAVAYPQAGQLILTAQVEGDFVRFGFTDKRRTLTPDALHQLFYPSLQRGAEYLLCKQIVRDHDEYAGRRGCRIQAQAAEGGGFEVFFTIPLKSMAG